MGTATTRASALSFGKPYFCVPPDGTVDAADRHTVANAYSGILASAVVVAPALFVTGRNRGPGDQYERPAVRSFKRGGVTSYRRR